MLWEEWKSENVTETKAGMVCHLERYLISPHDWPDYRDKVPEYILDNVINGPPDCIGFGYCYKLGWFVMGSGQGPCLLWAEKISDECSEEGASDVW